MAGAGALAVDPQQNESQVRIALLQIAHRQGWCDYLSMQGQGDGARYHVRIDGTPRVLLQGEVKGWVLGLADSRGAAAAVAYRPGLLANAPDPGA